MPAGVNFINNGNGTANIRGTPSAGTAGNFTITITAHNGIGTDATQSFTLSVNAPPLITSASNTLFTAGVTGTFAVTSTGFPAPTLSESGALPSGVLFNVSTGVLSGIPAPGTGGSYPITFTAHNGAGTDATQSFTFTVNAPPAITSPNSATFVAGTIGSLTVTATGFPAPTLSESGALPSGVTFSASTGLLSGAPTASGTFPITFTAHNAVGPDAIQNFTLIVNQSPSFSSAASTAFIIGSLRSFPVAAAGVPAPALSESGPLPAGVTFNAGTGTLSGTPAAGTAGAYPVTFTAHNGVGSDATQNFTLTVTQVAAITSPGSTTVVDFVVGTTRTFPVTTTGAPPPSLSIGNLPSGVTFSDHGDGTGVLGGTPALGTVGSYPITVTAHNGVGLDATQSFTLSIGKQTATVALSGLTQTFDGTPRPVSAATTPSGLSVLFYYSGTGGTTYGPSNTAPTNAGSYSVTTTVNDPNYAGSGTGTLTVNQATPTITWATPAAITYGTPLGSTQLNATASVPGTFVYTPAAGAVPSAGTQTLSVTFTPTDSADYTTATKTVTISVGQATPTITWATPAAITYGTPLGSTQLNATASVPGTFVYTPAAGAVPSAGTQTLSVTFTPTDSANYTTATKTVAGYSLWARPRRRSPGLPPRPSLTARRSAPRNSTRPRAFRELSSTPLRPEPCPAPAPRPFR